MKKFFKQTLAILLAAVIVFGAAPLSGFVGLELPEFSFFNTKAKAAPTIISGKCGDNLTWVLDRSTGVLSIDGTGDMYDYERGKSSWDDYSYNVHSLIIGDNVTSIGAYAFYSCEIGSTVIISKNINKIGEGAFSCNPIESFSVSPDNINFSSDASGVLYNKDKTVLIQYPIANPRTSFSVPEGVLTIEEYSFGDGSTSSNKLGDETIENVIISDTVTTIKKCAFYSCQRLKSVTLGGSLTTIKEYAFGQCDSLLSISIPDSVETIGSGAFSYCDSLSEVTIGKGAVKDEDGDSLDFQSIFDDCLIKNYIVSNEHPLIYSIDGVVFSKSGEKNVLIAYPLGNPRTVYEIPEGTTDIYYRAFYGNENCRLKSLKVSNTISNLNNDDFIDLNYLEEIIVDNSHPTLLSEDGVLFSKDKTELMMYPMKFQKTAQPVPFLLRQAVTQRLLLQFMMHQEMRLAKIHRI